MIELKAINIKRNLNTKQHPLENDQNADTTLLHSHDNHVSIHEKYKRPKGTGKYMSCEMMSGDNLSYMIQVP